MLIKINGEEAKLPDFLIVGAAKSGTTSLYAYLQRHPQIFMPVNKEPWFFSFAGADKKDDEIFNRKEDIITDFNEYLDLFNDARAPQILGEASTTYLYLYEETIKNIKKYHPNWKELKIIIIIRDPAERVFSHYLNDSARRFNLSFEEVIEKWKLKQLSKYNNYIDYGFYYNQIRSYKDNFNQVKVYLFDDLEANSTMLVKDLLEFLDVDASFSIETSLKYNVSIDSNNRLLSWLIYKPNMLKGIIKRLLSKEFRVRIRNKILENFSNKPQLESSCRKFLKEIYKEDILKLQGLINRDLSHWLR